MASSSRQAPRHSFSQNDVPGLSEEAREAVTAAFDAMSTWRSEIASNNEKNIQNVIEKVSSAAHALGWPEQIVDATRAQMQSIAKLQIQTMDQIMDAWEEQIRSPGAMSGPTAMLSKLQPLAGSGMDMGAMNPMQLWMQSARQWQNAWVEMMAFWSKQSRR